MTKASSLLLATLAAASLLSGPAEARKSCPPGLAKKAIPCVPPGLARKGGHRYEQGDYIEDDEDYHRIRYPDRYGLPPLGPGERYVIVGNQVYRVRSDTYQILSVLQAVQSFLD